MVEVVYEVGINANGSVETAERMIDVAVASGCNYVKFQKRKVDLVYTPEELAVFRESPWGTTTKDQKEGLEFGASEYQEIDKYCQGKDERFCATAYKRWVRPSTHLFLDGVLFSIINL